MNKIIFTLILLIVFGCSTKKGEAQNQVSVSDKTKAIQNNNLVEKFSHVINGSWVVADYLNDVLKTKSPFKSNEKLENISTLVINTKEIIGDSLIIGMSLNNHEGSSATLYFREGEDQNSLQTNIMDFENKNDYFELELSKQNDVAVLYLKEYQHFKGRNNKLIKTVKYIKVSDEISDDVAYGIEHFINKSLIGGSYQLLNSNPNKEVVFNEDGKVKGFDNFKNYFVQTDFMVRVENNLDNITFTSAKEDEAQNFIFEFHGDTLKLFNYQVSDDHVSLEKTDLKYLLVKRSKKD